MRDIKSGLTSMVYNFFDKKTASDTIKNENNVKEKSSWRVTQNNY